MKNSIQEALNVIRSDKQQINEADNSKRFMKVIGEIVFVLGANMKNVKDIIKQEPDISSDAKKIEKQMISLTGSLNRLHSSMMKRLTPAQRDQRI